MGESFVRGDIFADNGVPLIDRDQDLCPGNVGGQIVPLPFILVVDATSSAGTKMKFVGSTNTYAIPYKDGSIIGLGVSAHTALGASRHATFTVYNGATSTGFAANLLASGQVTKISQNKDLDTFSAGDKLNILCEHASMTTYTMAAILYVEM